MLVVEVSGFSRGMGGTKRTLCNETTNQTISVVSLARRIEDSCTHGPTLLPVEMAEQ